MKKTTTFILLFFFGTALAQNGKYKEKIQQVKSLKVAFITNELELTSDEAAKFWPIYNAFDDKQKELRKQKIGTFLEKDRLSLDKMTDKDASALLTQMENNEEESHQLRKKFTHNLKAILPSLKIIKLRKAEEDFNRKLLKQYRAKKPR